MMYSRNHRLDKVLVLAALLGTLHLCDRTSAQCDILETYTLVPPNGQPADEIASAVATNGDIIVVAAPYDDDVGAVHLFDAASGELLATIVAPGGDPWDRFGNGVAIEDHILVVTAPNHFTGAQYSGAAYLYDASDPTSPRLMSQFTHDNEVVWNQFGLSVAIDGSLVIVGANHGGWPGTAHVFDVSDPVNPVFMWTLEAVDGEDGDAFGTSVDIDGTRAIVGAQRNDDNGFFSGAAYTFDVTTGELLVELYPNPNTAEQFGHAVAISGNRAIVGSPYRLYTYPWVGAVTFRDADTGQWLDFIVPDQPEEHGFFGWSLAVDQGRLVIGAFQGGGRTGQTGAAYLIDIESADQLHKLIASDGESEDFFGGSVALAGSTIVVGALKYEYHETEQGSAYVFRHPDEWLTLQVEGNCRDRMSFQISGANPGAEGAVIVAFDKGGVRVPGGYPCVGTALCLSNSARVYRTGVADNKGIVSFSARVNANYCGRLHVQAIDLSDCETSKVILIE